MKVKESGSEIVTHESSRHERSKSKKVLRCGRAKQEAGARPNRDQVETWRAQLRAFLVKQGLKYTEQRWKIAELILSTDGHLDAQELVEQVRKKHSGIGAATVYRTIKVLCEASLLKESLTDSQGRVVYELYNEHHHDHLVCIDCGEIFEFHDEKIEALQSAVIDKLGFEEVHHRHVIYARCRYRLK